LKHTRQNGSATEVILTLKAGWGKYPDVRVWSSSFARRESVQHFKLLGCQRLTSLRMIDQKQSLSIKLYMSTVSSRTPIALV
jgi:hypothetical protein